jgi:hypothetical protein
MCFQQEEYFETGIVLPEHYRVCLAGAVCLQTAVMHIVLMLG